MNELLAKVKLALRITTDDFDSELKDLINACFLDLGIAGVSNHIDTSSSNALTEMAVKTYCKMHFGDINGVEQFDRLKKSYDEQKAQLQMSTGYTVWL